MNRIIILTTLCMILTTGIVHADDGAAKQEPSPQETASELTSRDYIIAGYMEKVSITIRGIEAPITMEAKLDSGADSSSMHAEDIVLDEDNDTVTFTVLDQQDRKQRVTCEYDRIVRIKKRPSGYQRRAVIPVVVTIGSKKLDAFINLADRSNFSSRMLIGRKELRRGILVDSSRRNLLSLPEGQ